MLHQLHCCPDNLVIVADFTGRERICPATVIAEVIDVGRNRIYDALWE